MGQGFKTVIDIEDFLRWVYATQCADVVSGGGVMAAGPREYGSALHTVLGLGTAVDCYGGGVENCDLHPDADAAHEVVVKLAPVERELVIRYAKMGTRPDAMVGAVIKTMAVRRDNGKVVKLYSKSRNAIGCPVVFAPTWKQIVNARSEWRMWWGGIARVAAELKKTGLREHLISGPSAPKWPWETNG